MGLVELMLDGLNVWVMLCGDVWFVSVFWCEEVVIDVLV